ncbi:MAG: hypothetical protein JWM96_71 [Alphaproteobacteria bacterium]|nr:hypothetical protein [Alphaproteobacteria bacterium]
MRFLLTVVFLGLILTAPALAQNNDMRAVMNRMDQLQRQMDTMSRQVYTGEAPADGSGIAPPAPENAGLAAAMDERLGSMEGSLRQLTNRLDEQDNEISQLKQQFELYKSDMEVRLKEMGTGASAAASSPAPSSTPSSSSPLSSAAPIDTNAQTAAMATSGSADTGASQSLPNDSATSLYDASFQALREQKYDRAEAGFKEFLQKYKTDPLAGNAQYWLGETFYVRGNYPEAAKVFAQGYKTYPKSTKGPDNLLKLGLALSQSGKKQDACVILQQLNTQYSSAASVIKQRAADERKKLNCGDATG